MTFLLAEIVRAQNPARDAEVFIIFYLIFFLYH